MMAHPAVALIAPISGMAVGLEAVPDPVFATGMMGVGLAILPQEGEVRAPLAGKVGMLFPSHHAVALRTADEIEVLVHVGIETAKMGELFVACVSAGDTVSAGDLLLRFDLPGLTKKALSPLCPVIISTLPPWYRAVPLQVGRRVLAGVDPVLEICREG